MTITARYVDFGDLRIGYDKRVLEPRPWTTGQSRWARRLAEEVPAGPVLELCCGAGQIGLLALRGSTRRLVMVDADEVACWWTAKNAAAAGLIDQVDVRHGRMQDVLAEDELFPLIIADPPWVASWAVGRFPHDPLLAIDGGADGLGVVRATVRTVAEHLLPSGAALVQVGPDQVPDVDELLTENPSLGLRMVHYLGFGSRGAVVELRRRGE
jgi:methylase of polypeptide subunit release factors